MPLPVPVPVEPLPLPVPVEPLPLPVPVLLPAGAGVGTEGAVGAVDPAGAGAGAVLLLEEGAGSGAVVSVFGGTLAWSTLGAGALAGFVDGVSLAACRRLRPGPWTAVRP
ncbi:MAG: hypothetical protein IPI85_09810 [Dehalococcoidia bacterium]|nr:hypothetical protein [Dehalococcoidia bacterium]